MKFYIFFLACLFVCCPAFAQDDTKDYIQNTKKADSLYGLKEYQKAVKLYSAAFFANGDQGKVKDRYKAASCWALLDNADSAFYQLNRIALKGRYLHIEEISNDSTLLLLHKDKRWTPLLEQVKKNKEDFESAPIINN